MKVSKRMRLIIVRCFIIVVVFSVAESKSLATENDVFQYLRKYGYIEDEATNTQLKQYAMNDFEADAIKDFQRMFHIPETGVIDDATKEAILQPRCGVKDKLVVNSHRQRRYVANQGSQWRHSDITYTVTTFTNDMSRSDQEAVFARAFKMWSDVTPLTFTYLPDRPGSEVDIELLFAYYNHGDPLPPFDGKDGVLAHAFFPVNGGDIHFDDSETFTLEMRGGTRELFQIAAHEIGHSLGLSHSYVPEALMAPAYRSIPNIQLHQDDINGVLALYGPIELPDPPPDEPREEVEDPSTVDFCQYDQFDAITDTDDGLLYGFRGPYAFNLAAQEVHPVLIHSVFPRAPYHLDAATRWPSRTPDTIPGKTFLFKGSYVWVYHGYEFQYKRLISYQFRGLSGNLDSAFVGRGYLWGTYFTRGQSYYSTNTNGDGIITSGSNRRITQWLSSTDSSITSGIRRIDSAVYWGNYTYFFSENRYYKYDLKNYKIYDGYPKSIKDDWYRCGEQDSPQPESPTNEPVPPQPELPAVETETSTKPQLPTNEPQAESPTNEPQTPVDFCHDDQFDAITRSDDGILYGFRGSYAINLGAQNLHPVLIDSVFPEAPHHIDAALYWPGKGVYTLCGNVPCLKIGKGKTFLFKGSYVWVYIGYEYQYKKLINNEFYGLPVDIDAAFVGDRRLGRKTYFTKGYNFYTTETNGNGRLETGGSRNLDYWLSNTNVSITSGISRIDGAINWEDNTYFFSGNRYYKFDYRNHKIYDGYPKSIKNDWYRCGEQDSPQPESPTNEPVPPQPESPTNEPDPPQPEYPTNEPDPPQPESPTNEPQNPPPVDLCQDDQFDAITRTDDGLYGFRGPYVYNLEAANVNAQPIEDVFPNSPSSVDAVLYWPGVGVDWSSCVNGQCLPEKGQTFLFKGYNVWVYIGNEFQYRSFISNEFPGLPNDIDSAFVWTGYESRKTFFTKGHDYYRTVTNGDGRMDSGYPKSLDVWMVNTDSAISSGIYRIDSATQWNNNTYFFTGNRYYRFTDKTFKIEEDYPKSIRNDWYRCQSNNLVAEDEISILDEITGNVAASASTTTFARLVFGVLAAAIIRIMIC